ncbi:hypothetical protein AJ79_03168 [Helicocarpus griseus UAMH5409]|uniref:Mid2 domain-containing protein n=1 Tax=Helicocarpus griseus UAMH5409 TaxID=1447875 RepID=A0A2B7XZ25_9EURO|nr:hypothetical protein AJ79_03168 [Helicocarpus griseus UAMH5409]
MRSLFFSIFFSLFFLGLNAAADSPLDYWVVPTGAQDNFTVTLRNGDSVPLAWKGWSDSWVKKYLNKKDNNDLWVTSYDYDVAPFAKLIAENIDVSKSGSFTWSIDIPGDTLSKTAKYILRFKNRATPRDSYTHKSRQLTSPGFIIVGDPKVTSTSATTSAPTTTTSNTAPTPSPQAPLSTGAKAGIGVGVAVGAAAVIALIVWAFVIRRRQKDQTPREVVYHTPQNPPTGPPVYPPSEAPDTMAMAPMKPPVYAASEAPYGMSKAPMEKPPIQEINEAPDTPSMAHTKKPPVYEVSGASNSRSTMPTELPDRPYM